MRPAVRLEPGAPAGTMMLDWLASADSEGQHRMLREHMVERQIQAGRASAPRVLAALRSVPRHVFAPPHLRAMAYHDTPLDIGHGQTMSQPLMVAMMLDALALRGHEHVLEIGTGSGYQAALLSRLARQVHTVEIVPALARAAARALAQTGCANVTAIEADGRHGWPAAACEARYDAVIVTAAAIDVPAALLAQLRVGGCLIMPVGNGFFQSLLRVRKHEDATEVDHLGVCSFAPLLDAGALRDDDAGADQQLREVESACRQVGELLDRVGTMLDPGLRIQLRTALEETQEALDAASTRLAVRRARFLTHLADRAATVLDAPA